MASSVLSHTSSRDDLLAARARFMRFHPTASEALLFSALRGKRLGVSFRRQQVIGSHIVDFLARKARLVVEVDTVVRVPASLVERDLSRAVEIVRVALATAMAN